MSEDHKVSISDEKAKDATLPLPSLNQHDLTAEEGFDERRTKNLLWKIDRNIVPFLSLLYL
jgi:hypothetical protein